jgi:hypothetical protein
MIEDFNLLLNIGRSSYYIPLLFVLFYLFKIKNNRYTNFERLLFFNVTYNGIVIALEQFILDGHIENINPLYNIVTIIDFFTITAIFTIILHDLGEKILKFLKYLIVTYLLISITELLFVNDLYSINLYSNNISKSLIIIIAGITIYYSEIKIEISSSQKIFTYTVFMYSILTLPITLFEQFLRLKASNYLYIIWSLNILFAILYNLSLTLALWKWKK